ncbi:hypothetical protein LQR31_22025 [Chromobacterium vaccinii]|uniref:hypothetical protein n=1 Tax=Chromobacterium vaccinii TaxID=1108595 RepID=UPI001E532CD9|nr:hypothetical protein [Chromobacterium vaccinii]MCD4487152.1 hypothetical protein [Chromobacterium vaccinii]
MAMRRFLLVQELLNKFRSKPGAEHVDGDGAYGGAAVSRRAVGWAELAKPNVHRYVAVNIYGVVGFLGKRWASFHSAQPTALEQEIRATTRVAPDGSIDRAFRDSTRFMSARDMGAAMQRADSIFNLNGGVNKAYSFQMESFIGEGYAKSPNSNWMFTTNVNAVYRNGQPYTMFPLLRPVQ